MYFFFNLCIYLLFLNSRINYFGHSLVFLVLFHGIYFVYPLNDIHIYCKSTNIDGLKC